MKTLAWIVTLLFLISCNPVKRVLRDPAKTQKVVDAWRADHPVEDDSTVINIVGVTNIDIKYDTLQPASWTLPKFSVPTLLPSIIVKTIKETRVDSVKVVKWDNEMIRGLQRIVQSKNGTIQALEDRNKKDRKELNMYRWLFIASLIVIVGRIAYSVYKGMSTIKIKSA